jgi:hypothetical protein
VERDVSKLNLDWYCGELYHFRVLSFIESIDEHCILSISPRASLGDVVEVSLLREL